MLGLEQVLRFHCDIYRFIARSVAVLLTPLPDTVNNKYKVRYSWA